MRLRFLAAAFSLLAITASGATGRNISPTLLKHVSIDHSSMNPSLGGVVALSLDFAMAAEVTVLVLDRDGVAVRTLAAKKPEPRGETHLVWDGRNDAGEVVPDEAYSFKVDWVSGREKGTYFPANTPAEMRTVSATYYDRRGGTLAYRLDVPSRVHIQAGSAVINASRTKADGPVLKTIVNREPRVAGAIAEHWNGFDESGAIYVPDVPNFVTAIAVTPLPENSVITFGNRKQTFIDSVAKRRGHSQLTMAGRMHAHHASLTAMEDVSPPLLIEPLNATWSARDAVWVVAQPVLRLRVAPKGPTAGAFTSQPGRVFRFVNESTLGSQRSAGQSMTIDVPVERLAGGVGRVTVNWVSDQGPVAANTIRIRRSAATSGQEHAR
jgi:flagellar hook assembly protein FlgD